MKNLLRHLPVLLLLIAASCTNDIYDPFPNSRSDRAKREGLDIRYDRVMIYYVEGYNNLSGEIKNNISQLEEGFIPDRNDKEAIVIYTHNAQNNIDFTTPVEPVIYQLYKMYGQTVRDTVKSYSSDEITPRAGMVSDILSTIKAKFPSRSYGLVFSSHASGWIPSGYKCGHGDVTPVIAPSSIGAQYDGSTFSTSFYYALDVDDFAEALPMDLDYIIFDCCLMGGVETNYVLRDKVRYIVAAPTEVMSYGFNYTTLADRLLNSPTIDLKGVCDDFYDKLSTSYLTVALYDCSVLDELADVCGKIFTNHPNAALGIDADKVQSYNYSFSYHYDFRDIIAKMGASADELAELDKVLSKHVLYKLATPTFIGTPINEETFSGLSMYLPRSNWPTLNSLYKQTLWNQSTSLLE